jgi:hypothetical protein
MGYREDLEAIERLRRRLEGLTPRECGRVLSWLATRTDTEAERIVPGLHRILGEDWRAVLLTLAVRLYRRRT